MRVGREPAAGETCPHASISILLGPAGLRGTVPCCHLLVFSLVSQPRESLVVLKPRGSSTQTCALQAGDTEFEDTASKAVTVGRDHSALRHPCCPTRSHPPPSPVCCSYLGSLPKRFPPHHCGRRWRTRLLTFHLCLLSRSIRLPGVQVVTGGGRQAAVCSLLFIPRTLFLPSRHKPSGCFVSHHLLLEVSELSFYISGFEHKISYYT